MSYDLEVRKDTSYSASSSLATVTNIITGIPHVLQTSEITFEFEVEKLDLFAEIYCEQIDDQGESIDLSMSIQGLKKMKINCIRICVPYANLHRDVRDELYMLLSGEIAKQLGWKVVDLQINRELLLDKELLTALKGLT